MNYIYDGSFDGLLTAIFEAYYRREVPEGIFSEHYYQQSLLDQGIHIATDPEKAYRVYISIQEKISQSCLHNVFYLFLSDDYMAGTLAYQYLRLGWKVGNSLEAFLTKDCVVKVNSLVKKVTGECHRMLGLLRFKQLDNEIYYASIEPDHNITGLIAPHFASRMADQNWIIHDLKRGVAAMYNKTEWVMTDIDFEYSPRLSESEKAFLNLWKQYFKSAAIKSRINPGLQRQHMPRRYWKHLVEMGM